MAAAANKSLNGNYSGAGEQPKISFTTERGPNWQRLNLPTVEQSHASNKESIPRH